MTGMFRTSHSRKMYGICDERSSGIARRLTCSRQTSRAGTSFRAIQNSGDVLGFLFTHQLQQHVGKDVGGLSDLSLRRASGARDSASARKRPERCATSSRSKRVQAVLYSLKTVRQACEEIIGRWSESVKQAYDQYPSLLKVRQLADVARTVPPRFRGCSRLPDRKPAVPDSCFRPLLHGARHVDEVVVLSSNWPNGS